MRSLSVIVVSLCLLWCSSGCGGGGGTTEPPPETGSIAVSSNPSGARIALDGIATGRLTPNTLTDLSPGTYTILLTKDCWESLATTTIVVAGTVSQVAKSLTPLCPTDSTLFGYVTIPPGDSVIVDAFFMFTTPGSAYVYVGEPTTKQVVLRNPCYSDHVESITFTAGIPVYRNFTHGAPLCPGGIIGDPSQTPTVAFTDITPGATSIYGTANNIDAQHVRVVLWALTNRWYIQPLIASPFTSICCDGSWSNWTHGWNRMLALLVDETYVPSDILDYHPSLDPGVLAWTEYPSPRDDRPIVWSGYSWWPKATEDPFDPGPNYFSDSPENVWVDEYGYLHLKITSRDGRWYCPELYSVGYFDRGEFTVQIESRVDNLDPNATFSPFLYAAPNQEIDFAEFSRALVPPPQNAQFVVQPYSTPGNIYFWNMSPDAPSTLRGLWCANRVEFIMWKGVTAFPPYPDMVNASWIYRGTDTPSPGGMRFRINLWLLNGQAPSVGDEVVVRSFSYRQ